MWAKGRGAVIDIVLSASSRRKPGPIRRGDHERGGVCCLVLPRVSAMNDWGYGSRPSPGRRNRGVSSRHRKAQRLAAARHVDGGKAGRGETARAAVALLIGFELALAGAKRGAPTP